MEHNLPHNGQWTQGATKTYPLTAGGATLLEPPTSPAATYISWAGLPQIAMAWNKEITPGLQWLGLSTITAKGAVSIPGWGSKILQSIPSGQKKTHPQ